MNDTLLLQWRCNVATLSYVFHHGPAWGPELGEPMLQAAGVTTPRQFGVPGSCGPEPSYAALHTSLTQPVNRFLYVDCSDTKRLKM